MSDLPAMIPDDPENDCTPFAHPAWDRGQQYGAENVMREVNEILNSPAGTPLHGVCNEPWESLRRRLANLRDCAHDDVSAMNWQPTDADVQHGVNCEKAPHSGGNLHDESDDSPFDVDGVRYCGRCHHWMPLPEPPA